MSVRSLCCSVIFHLCFLCVVSCTQQDQQLGELSKLYEGYQLAEQFLEKGELGKAVQKLREVNQRYPTSRAVLESLVMAEMKSESTTQQVGYQRIQSYIAKHPGDGQLRLAQAKYHLTRGFPSKANADLQILLFNKVFHPWVLAQDRDLQRHKHVLEESKLPFELIQPLSATISPRLIQGDRGEIVMETLHLSTCDLTVRTTNLQVDLHPKRIAVYREIVDDVVTKSKLVLHYDTASPGTQSNLSTQVECGDASLTVQLPPFEVLNLKSIDADPAEASFTNIEVPSIEQLQRGSPIPWRMYQNQILLYQGP